MPDLAARIDQILPQTQCRQCGYTGCLPYAQAVAAGSAAINLCLPGKDEVMRDIAALTGQTPQPVAASENCLAVIDEQACIGCTACIKACPSDAIVGAGKLMHTVIADECTGCGLCLPPCPVDCIAMLPESSDYLPRRPILSAYPQARFAAAEHARARFAAKTARSTRPRRANAQTHPARPDISALLARAQNRAAANATERIAVQSQDLQQTLLAQQKTRAAYRNAQRALRHGTETERVAALDYLRSIKTSEE